MIFVTPGEMLFADGHRFEGRWIKNAPQAGKMEQSPDFEGGIYDGEVKDGKGGAVMRQGLGSRNSIPP